MLKKRVIACLLLDDGQLCRTKKFVPDYRYLVEFVGTEAVDEVFIVDVTKGGPSPRFHAAAQAYADKCFVPVTMGGWVRTLDDCGRLFDCGADKIVVGLEASLWTPGGPDILEGMARKFGSQAVVVGIDRRSCGDGRFAGRAAFCQRRGAGEIFLQSVERDGSLAGYDIPLLESVLAVVNVPVVIGGGCGGWRHMREAFAAGADGCATSNIHHFTEGAMAGFKANLGREGVPVRP